MVELKCDEIGCLEMAKMRIPPSPGVELSIELE